MTDKKEKKKEVLKKKEYINYSCCPKVTNKKCVLKYRKDKFLYLIFGS